MKRSLSTLQHRYIIWLLMAAIIVIVQPSCNTEKRVTKKLMKLDKDNLNKVRPWPHNYTYHEYVNMLDNAKIRQEFYRKRELQARIAEDKRTQKTMQKNVDDYQKTIDKLEKDRQFYKIYKLREKEIQVKIKQEQKVQKGIERQKANADKEASRRDKETEKQKEQLIKERQHRLDEKKNRLENEKEELVSKNKENSKIIKHKKKELAELQKIADESGDADDPNFVEGISVLTMEVQQLETEKQDIEQKLDAIAIEIEAFIEEYYTPKDTVIENHMILSTDPIPQKTNEKIDELPDDME